MLKIEYRKLAELHPNPKNPRKATKEAVEKLAESIKGNPQFFEARPILLSDRTGVLVIIGGERRSEAARLLEMETVPTILFSGLSEAQEDEILIKDNTHAGVWDEQKLLAWGKEQLQDWGVPESDARGGGDKTLINPYSFKLTSPIYQIQGMKPSEADIVNTEKVDALLSEIDAAPVPEKVKKMLRVCAYRHAVIDFEGMAEYYAHANKTVQRLMESNALVIIDFDKAVENGFVKMTKDLQNIYDKNTEALKDAE